MLTSWDRLRASAAGAAWKRRPRAIQALQACMAGGSYRRSGTLKPMALRTLSSVAVACSLAASAPCTPQGSRQRWRQRLAWRLVWTAGRPLPVAAVPGMQRTGLLLPAAPPPHLREDGVERSLVPHHLGVPRLNGLQVRNLRGFGGDGSWRGSRQRMHAAHPAARKAAQPWSHCPCTLHCMTRLTRSVPRI